MEMVERLTLEGGLERHQVENTLELIHEGATVPFIARYRKERTGNLDETQIREIVHKSQYYTELDERRETILKTIKSQGKLTPALEEKIRQTSNKAELEDLYLPYKPKRETRASKAKKAGLEPLARWLFEMEDRSADIESKAAEFLNTENGFDTPQKTLQGAFDILAEEISENSDLRKWLRELVAEEGILTSSVRQELSDTKTKFQMYHDFQNKVKDLRSHQILALFRGEKEKVLRLKYEIPFDKACQHIESNFIKHPDSASVEYLKSVVEDSLSRLLLPAIETEIRKELRLNADEESFKVFGENLKEILLAPPAGQKSVLGIDPGFRTGCKVVALDETGKFLDYETIYPHEPQKNEKEAKQVLQRMIAEHHIEMIAIGNGTASRETEILIRRMLQEYPDQARPLCAVVSEAGASVYSASPLANREFPDFDVTVRGAISIGRRLQDPLAELVKIDPKSIGVGQYQHDVSQSQLKQSLEEVVESCVNLVGIDINLASSEILKYVSGLSLRLAEKIVEFRNIHGGFLSREDIKKVPGMGEKAFEQAAGFLMIPRAGNPLDNSAVHPERYPLVQEMAKRMNVTIDQLTGNVSLLKSMDKNQLLSEDVGMLTIEDILSELEKPGRDPRKAFSYAQFSDEVKEISDLEIGMVLEGIVTNVTNFGAFVDIGVHQDGLVHISQIADHFVKNLRDEVKIGQVVKVKVMDVDKELKRISLSMKTVTHSQ